jgi:hypothetical protein
MKGVEAGLKRRAPAPREGGTPSLDATKPAGERFGIDGEWPAWQRMTACVPGPADVGG